MLAEGLDASKIGGIPGDIARLEFGTADVGLDEIDVMVGMNVGLEVLELVARLKTGATVVRISKARVLVALLCAAKSQSAAVIPYASYKEFAVGSASPPRVSGKHIFENNPTTRPKLSVKP